MKFLKFTMKSRCITNKDITQVDIPIVVRKKHIKGLRIDPKSNLIELVFTKKSEIAGFVVSETLEEAMSILNK